MDQRTKRTLWIAAIAIFVVALVVHHNITEQEIIIFCCVVPSIILHEISHGWVAKTFGDDTADRAGRLTLNPVSHMDPVGTLIVPALLVAELFGVIGWAKPVPVNTAKAAEPAQQGVLVVAGRTRRPTPCSLQSSGSSSCTLPARVCRLGLRRVAQWSTAAQILFLASLGQRGAVRLQPGPGSTARRLGCRRASLAGALVADLPALPPVHDAALLDPRAPQLLLLERPRGPLTWLFDRLYNWWGSVLGI